MDKDNNIEIEESFDDDNSDVSDSNLDSDSFDLGGNYRHPVGYFPGGGFGAGLKSGLANGNSGLSDTIEKNKAMNTPNGTVTNNGENEDSENSSNQESSDNSDDKLQNKSDNTKNEDKNISGKNLNDSSEVEGDGKAKSKIDIKKQKAVKLRRMLIIIGISVFAIFIIFLLLMGAVYVVFDKFTFKDNGNNSTGYVDVGDDSGFWWPVGSNETTTNNGKTYASGQPALTSISSGFQSNRCLGGTCNAHYGIDVGSNDQINVYNLIASKSGTVVKVSNDCDDNGDLKNYCNGGLGNYVTIDHGNGYYTRYQHMAKNSIVVSEGDSVDQGQVIGKIGQSGRCQGAHLHFQVHIGGTSNSYAVDPTKYVDPNNPRPVASSSASSSSELVKMIQYFEGTGPVSGDSYIAYKYSYDVLTIGHGVTIPYNRKKFQDHGINPDTITVGTKISKSIVDAIEAEIIQDHYNSVVDTLNKAGLSLKQNQIDALVSRHYNTGNIKGFVNAYKKYGDTDALFAAYMSSPVTAKGKYLAGLARRRASEWKLFHEGVYTY